MGAGRRRRPARPDRRVRRVGRVELVDPVHERRRLRHRRTRSSARDIGFYVFRLPFLSFVVELAVRGAADRPHRHGRGPLPQRRHPGAGAAPAGDAAGEGPPVGAARPRWPSSRPCDYWLQRYELTVSTRGVVDGATYTDVNAQLPALNLLMLISIAAAVLVHRQHLPARAGCCRSSRSASGCSSPSWPAGSTPRSCSASRSSRTSRRRSGRTSSATSTPLVGALDLERRRRSSASPPTTDTGSVELAGAEPTIRNIRLWDPAASLSGQTFEQLQRIRNYYAIDDVDVDRYEIDGETTQVNIGAREISPSDVPGDSWEAAHLTYTHGYGVALAPSNATVSSEPDFLVGNVPPEIDPSLTDSGFALEQPGCTSARTSTATSSSAPIAPRSTSRTRTTRRRRPPTRATTACRPTRSSGGRRSRCASATSTRSSPTS